MSKSQIRIRIRIRGCVKNDIRHITTIHAIEDAHMFPRLYNVIIVRLLDIPLVVAKGKKDVYYVVKNMIGKVVPTLTM